MSCVIDPTWIFTLCACLRRDHTKKSSPVSGSRNNWFLVMNINGTDVYIFIYRKFLFLSLFLLFFSSFFYISLLLCIPSSLLCQFSYSNDSSPLMSVRYSGNDLFFLIPVTLGLFVHSFVWCISIVFCFVLFVLFPLFCFLCLWSEM